MNLPLTSVSFPYITDKKKRIPWPSGMELTIDCSECTGKYRIKFVADPDPAVSIEPMKSIKDEKIEISVGVFLDPLWEVYQKSGSYEDMCRWLKHAAWERITK